MFRSSEGDDANLLRLVRDFLSRRAEMVLLRYR